MSEKEEIRCCMCLGAECSCIDKTNCCCAPLLFFCPTCLAAKDNSDKMACTDCLQRMMAEYSRMPQESNNQKTVAILKSKTIAEFREEITKIVGSKLMFALNVLHKSYLHTIERMVMKAVLFNVYCPSSFICLVSTVPEFVPVQGLLTRTLIAQKWFSKTCKATKRVAGNL